jgi:hypothetical protein
VSADIRAKVLKLDPEAVTLWRCTKCAKWSHAMKQPARHKRFVLNPENIPDEEMAEYLPDTNGQGSDGAMVWCGPFVRYTAVRG